MDVDPNRSIKEWRSNHFAQGGIWHYPSTNQVPA